VNCIKDIEHATDMKWANEAKARSKRSVLIAGTRLDLCEVQAEVGKRPSISLLSTSNVGGGSVIREMSLNQSFPERVASGGNDQCTSLTYLRPTSMEQIRTYPAQGIVGSVRWQAHDENIFSWTTDNGHFERADIRMAKPVMTSRHAFSPFLNGGVPLTHAYLDQQTVLIGYDDGFIDCLDMRKGLMEPKLIYRQLDPSLTTVGDIQVSLAKSTCAIMGCPRGFGLLSFKKLGNGLHRFETRPGTDFMSRNLVLPKATDITGTTASFFNRGECLAVASINTGYCAIYQLT